MGSCGAGARRRWSTRGACGVMGVRGKAQRGAITDRFAGKTFIGKTNNDKSSKNTISIWTRIDWAQGLSSDGGLRGVIANYKQNIVEAGQCKPAMTKQHADLVKQRFGQKGKEMSEQIQQREGEYLLFKAILVGLRGFFASAASSWSGVSL